MIDSLPHSRIREASQALAVLQPLQPLSLTRVVTFAQVVGWHRRGDIVRAGGVERFAKGYLSKGRNAWPEAVAFPPTSIRRFYNLVLEAEAKGLLGGAPLPEAPQDPEPLPAPIAPAPAAPPPVAPAPEPAPVKARKVKPAKPAPEAEPADDLRALWDRMQEAYKAHAPKAWPRLSRRLTLAPGTRSKIADAVAVAGGADQFLATVELALRNVPAFYRTTYLENGRGAPDCLSLLLQGNAATKHLGVDGWGVFNWTDRVDLATPSATPAGTERHNATFDRGYWYGPDITTPEQRRAARDWLYRIGEGPHPDAGSVVAPYWHEGRKAELGHGSEWFPVIPPAAWVAENGGQVPAWVETRGKPWRPWEEDVEQGAGDPPPIFAGGACFAPF